MSSIESLFESLTLIDWLVLGLNLLLFVFARIIVSGFRPVKDTTAVNNKALILRVISVVLFVLTLLQVVMSDWTKQLSQTGLTLLVVYLVVHLLQYLVLQRYGKVKEFDNTEYRVETYQSEVFGLILLVSAIMVSILIIINIWEMTDWLKATSVLGGILIIIFSTKDVWAPDNINGLIMLYNGDVEPGSLVKIDEYDLVGVAIGTTLTQTRFRDLKSRHQIIMPNSKVRNSKIEVLNKCPAGGLMRSIDLNLAYGVSVEAIESYLTAVWEKACESEKSINEEKTPKILLVENGDHAVTWRLCYWVKNIYAMYDAEFAVNRIAYELSIIEGIGLNTPLTHEVSYQRDEDV